jgi:hypothetical protein
MRTTPVLTAPRPVPPPSAPVTPAAWTPARTAWLSAGVTAVLGAALLAAAGGAVHLVDEQHRDGAYLTSDTVRVGSPGHAVTVEEIDLDGLSEDWLLGTARVRATGTDGAPVFIGVAPTDAVADYLDGVAHSTVTELDDTAYAEHPGGAPSQAPTASDIWTDQASGTGTQSMTWKPSGGNWTVVVMNADGSADVHAEADVGATVPVLGSLVRWLLALSALLAVGGALALRFLQVSGRRRSAGAR